MRILITLLILGFATQSFAAKLSKIGCFGNLAGVNRPQELGENPKVSESEIRQVMELIYIEYANEFTARGWTLQMNYLVDDTFNAFARRDGDVASVNILSGLGMNDLSNTDVIALVTCHELGHHIGGRPFYTGSDMSTEGQADYFAGIECMRRYYDVTPFKVPLDIGALKSCRGSWSDKAEVEACARTVGAGQALAKIFAGNNVGLMSIPDLTRRNTERVTELFESHPEAQCRLDTYAAGALCTENFGEPVAQDDVWTGVCSEERGDRTGVRPRCWYSPLSIAIPR